jgi:hypothetical protein
MVDVLGLIPTTIGGVIGLLIQVLIIWIAVMLSDKIIAHQIEAKHSLILAVLAYFLVPLVFSFAAIGIPYASIVVSLAVWIALSEVLLRQTPGFVAKIKVAAVAFVIYLILTFANISGIISGMIG